MESIQNYTNRRFIIFDVTELDHIDFEQVIESSADTVRKSMDGTKTFVKWEGETPECIGTLTTQKGPYTYEEIIKILAAPEWTSNEQPF
jgi:hypothetical protein